MKSRALRRIRAGAILGDLIALAIVVYQIEEAGQVSVEVFRPSDVPFVVLLFILLTL